MKLNIRRETTIGLSLLLLLLVILGVVATRRFMRRGPHPEETVAALEEMPLEARFPHHEKHEEDSSRKPSLPAPEAAPRHESERRLDDLGNWNNPSREVKTEMPKHEREAGLTAPDPPVVASPPAGAKPDRTERRARADGDLRLTRAGFRRKRRPLPGRGDGRGGAGASAGGDGLLRRASCQRGVAGRGGPSQRRRAAGPGAAVLGES